MVPQLVRNDVSSTKVRLFVRKGMSIEYLLPGAVSKYIRRHGLYQDGFVVQSDGSQLQSVTPMEVTLASGKASEQENNADGESSSEELTQDA